MITITNEQFNLTNFVKIFSKNYFKNYKNINILESGAANGNDTDFFCNNFPSSKIFSFEPDPRFLENFIIKKKLYQNLYFSNNALSNFNGKTKFYLSTRYDNNRSEVWGSSSILKPKKHLEFHPQIKFEDCIEVECCILDDYMKINNIENFDMMWLDMQGYEFEVLDASPNSTLNCHFIYSEIQLIETYENNKVYNELKNLLSARNFSPVIEELPWKDGGNVLFANNKFINEINSTINYMLK